ncbi:chemotaxis protein [Vibrio alginolyticus]|uniref:chemotaxis protein n=1 Tax=Vibrio alginolyticus TaxID=663 RepID=UPI0022AE5D03|nr:chemotaxis protein [Vibrio alginolyticus]MCZ4387628.1 chemotaxis protein [Vibrio alginolyticus]
MSIKQSIASLVILLSVSFSAFSKTIEITSTSSYSIRGCNLSVGDVVDVDTYFACVSGSYDYGTIWACKRSGGSCIGGDKHENTDSGGRIHTNLYDSYGKHAIGVSYGYRDSEPPPSFCNSQDTINEMKQYESSCLADGGSPTIICNDKVDPPDFRMSCDIAPPPPDPDECTPDSSDWPACKEDENKCDENDPDWDPRYGTCCRPENNWCDVPPPESCVIGGPNWPACADDIDVDPPTGGDLGDPDKPSGGGGGGSTDPDKPEPDVDNTSDTLAAIKAMNKDVNSQLTGLNNDMNKNQAETKSALDALKASVDLNTDTVVDNANHVANAINGQSDMLSDIGNNTNRLLTSANNLLNDGFGRLSNDLGDLESTNQKGFGDVVDAIEGLGKPMVDGGGGGAVVPLYSATQLHNLNAEITVLKNEYKDLLNQYRAYFNFTSDVNGGDYNAHNIELTVRGNVVRQQNAVMAALQDNAGIIGAVVLFVFGLLGIRAIGGAF